MEKLIVIINGKGGVGKDTLCNIVSNKYKAENISSITPILKVAKAGGWDGIKNDKSRKLLSDLKVLFENYNSLSFNYIKDCAEEFMLSDNDIMFVHLREPYNIDKYKNYLKSIGIKVVTLLVRRQDKQNIVYDNDADDLVDKYEYDYIYNNDYTLAKTANVFIEFFDKILYEAM